MYDEYMNERANAKRQRNAAQADAERAEAVQLWQSAQRGMLMWPAALKRPEFANSLSLIESIMRSWSPNNPTGDAYRRALATEAGVLRARVATDARIGFVARVEASRMLDRIQQLADLPSLEAGAPTLAMR